MSVRTPANNTEDTVPELYEDSTAQTVPLRTMADSASRYVGIYEIRLRLYLWELLAKVKQKKNASTADVSAAETRATGDIR
jgi:hypothetical protein